MSDTATDTTASSSAMERSLAELERRVLTLEARVASLPDTKQIEERVTERVKASLPPPAPLEDFSLAPQLKDIALPIPSTQTLVDTARTTWTIFEMMAELKLLFWMLVDRRYHMGWMARVIAVGLMLLILFSHFLNPLGRLDTFVSPIVDKCVDLLIGATLFTFLTLETRRYKEWRKR